MTLISKLEDYYGMASEFIRTEILKRTGSFTDDVLEDVYQKIINIHPIKRGFPDMTVFNKVLQEARLTKEPHVYYWNICNECGCEYSYSLPVCPKCWDRGYECRSYKLKTSDTKPAVKVIRYNKPYTTPIKDIEQTSCFDCGNSEMSYCYNFGNPNFNCRDFQYCKCKSCCAIHKRINKETLENKNPVKSFAIPRVKISV